MPRKKRLSPNQLAELKEDLAGLKTIQDYAPTKAEFKTDVIEAVDAQLDAKNEQISQAEIHLNNLRSEAAEIGEVYTKKMKGVRQQVVGQYGDDSPEYEAVGGTRASNRRRPGRRTNGGNTPNS